MIITVKENKDEDKKIKAYFNVELNDFQLKGFKLYENDEKELKLLMPSMMLKDKDGNEIHNQNTGKPINSQIIQINPELSNRKELFNELEKLFIDVYKESKEAKNENEHFSKNVQIQDLEKGELNVSTFNIPKSKGETKNNDIQLKASNSVFVGAFKVNNVNLFYNAAKNDFNISMPQYNYLDKKGKEVRNSFFVPKNPESHKMLKTKIVSSHKNKQSEYANMKKNSKNKNNTFNQNQEAKEAQAPTMK